MKKFNYVYKITNLINNKIYIGIHSTNSLNRKYLGSGKLIKQALKKYGESNFDKKIIAFCSSREECRKIERELVNTIFVERSDTYNLIEGGGGVGNQYGERNHMYGKIALNAKGVRAEHLDGTVVLASSIQELTSKIGIARGNIRNLIKKKIIGKYGWKVTLLEDIVSTTLRYVEVHKRTAHRVTLVCEETDGMYSQLLKPHLGRIYPCQVDEVRQNMQKELRIIDTLEPLMNQHRLIIDPKVITDDYDSAMKRFSADKALQYMMFYQMSRLSKERGALKHDDRLDALAIACKYFLDILDVDQNMQDKIRKEEALDKMLNNFIDEWYDGNGGTNNQPLKLWGR